MSDQDQTHQREPGEVREDETPETAAESDTDVDSIVEKLDAQNQELRDQLLRARAEQENLRRRAERDVENAHKYAVEKFAAELLSVCDSLEMGMDAARNGAETDKLIEGMDLTLNALRQVFDRFGIETVAPETGERFDAERHQAMTMQEHAEIAPNHIVAAMQKGYLLKGRVLRPAMVIVARAPAATDGEAS